MDRMKYTEWWNNLPSGGNWRRYPDSLQVITTGSKVIAACTTGGLLGALATAEESLSKDSRASGTIGTVGQSFATTNGPFGTVGMTVASPQTTQETHGTVQRMSGTT